MKPNQIAAIKKLEAALLSIKRSGLVLVGVDDNLFASLADQALAEESRNLSSVEAIVQRHNTGHTGTESVKHYGAYRDSGGA